MDGMKFEILTEKIAEDKMDSFWYYDDEIARVQFMNGKKLYAESRGGIALAFDEDDVYHKGQQAVDKAIDLDFNDTKLGDLDFDDLWRNNNWFAIIMVDINGDVCSDDLGIAGDYDEAIEMLKGIAEEEFKKMYS